MLNFAIVMYSFMKHLGKGRKPQVASRDGSSGRILRRCIEPLEKVSSPSADNIKGKASIFCVIVGRGARKRRGSTGEGGRTIDFA